MREVDDHTEAFHLADKLLARFRQTATLEAVRTSGELVIEEVRQTDHPNAGVKERAQLGGITVEGLGSFNAEQATHHTPVRPASREQLLDILACPNDTQLLTPLRRELLEASRLITSSLEAAPKCPERPGSRESEECDHVETAGIAAIDRGAHRDLCDEPEDLQGHAPLTKSGKVHVADAAAHTEVPAPEKRIRVQVHDRTVAVEALRPLRDGWKRRTLDPVHPGLDPPSDKPEGTDHCHDGHDQDGD
jgi:hypothetical protein